MRGLLALFLLSTLSLVLSCDNACSPSTCSPNNCNGGNGNVCQPVKIQYSANGMNLNVEIGCDNSCESCKPDPQFESCESCANVPFGRVAYGDDCSKFCECVQGRHTKVDSCPEGLSFNAERSVCDFKENVNCSSITTDDPAHCQSCENIIFGFVPFEEDCSKFCECFNGQINKVKQCNEGLLFNEEISNCDYASNTTCGTATPSSRPTPPYLTTTKPVVTTTEKPTTIPKTTKTPKPTTTPKTTKPTTPKPTTTVLPTFDPSCDCGSSSELIPYIGSCIKYCDCKNRIVEECPGGLYFDPVSTYCSLPTFVDCSYEVKSTTPKFTLPTPKYGTTNQF